MASREDCRRVMTEARDTPQHRAIDAWIAFDLASRYDVALLEPLPPDLLDLLSD